MPDAPTLLLFALASFALIITPGPNMLYILARSIGQGRRAGLVSVLGVDTGILVHVAAAALGLSALLLSSALLFGAVKYAGAAYLIYLGVRSLLAPAGLESRTLAPQSLPQLYRQGFITMLLNPKVAVFFLAFFPQFIRVSEGQVLLQTLVLGGVFLLIGTLVDCTLAFVAGGAGDRLRQNTRFWGVQKWVSGGVFIGLGISTALTGRD